MAGVGDALGFGGGSEVEGEDDEDYWDWWECASSGSSAPSSSSCFLLLLAFFHSRSTALSTLLPLSIHAFG